MFYWSLTGSVDLLWMRKHLVSYLKLVAFSVAALGLSACARMHLSDPTMFAVEPRLGEPPNAGAADQPAVVETEAQRMEALEAQVEGLGAQGASLRRALEIMGPLPDAGAGLVQATFPGAAKFSFRSSQLYASAPAMGEGGRSLFYEAELGSFRSRQAAEDSWRRMVGEAGVSNLNPRFTETGAETHLTVGPLVSEAAVNALCVELSALTGECRVAAPVRAF
jgi:hypothetical protein